MNASPLPNGTPAPKRPTTAWDRLKRAIVGRGSPAQEAREEAVEAALDALESAVEDTRVATKQAKQEVTRRGTGVHAKPATRPRNS